jgi:hypothetical protein
MGAYSNAWYDLEMKNAAAGPVVSAAPGFYRLDADWPDADPEPVLAWRIGATLALPVTRFGCDVAERYVVHPDGTVRRHFPPYSSVSPDFGSLAEWRADILNRRSEEIRAALAEPEPF